MVNGFFEENYPEQHNQVINLTAEIERLQEEERKLDEEIAANIYFCDDDTCLCNLKEGEEGIN